MNDWSFQNALVDGAHAALAKHKSVLLQLPTGGGKTVLGVRVAKGYVEEGRRVWVVVPRRFLVQQTADAMRARGMESAAVEMRCREVPDAAILAWTVQSLLKRIAKTPPPDLVVWDEAHHMAANSWRKLFATFPKRTRHLGLSATPERLDGEPLSGSFEHLLVGPQPAELQALGILAPCVHFAPSKVDLRRLRSSGGDYDRRDAEKAMMGRVVVADAVQTYLDKGDGRTAICFAASVKASRDLVERFKKAGVAAEHLDAHTPEDERKAIIARLKIEDTKIVSNVEIFTEGLDVDSIGAVILMRPTRSLALYLQMIGRGRRASERWPNLKIFDHAANFLPHGLANEERVWSLEKGRREANGAVKARFLRRCPECSAVHAFAAACPECGHAYGAADRSVREEFGELVEVGPEDGCETQSEFARRVGVPHSRVTSWIGRGLPTDANRNPYVAAALLWVKNNASSMPSAGCETKRAFARRVGANETAVGRWIVRGLPADANRNPRIAEALLWVKENAPPLPSDGCETQSAFARRVGAGATSVGRWSDRGLPTDANGNPRVVEALEWVRANAGLPPPPPSAGCEGKMAFARRVGSTPCSIRSWIKRGLPVDANGNPRVAEALEWVTKNARNARMRPPSVGCEAQAAFAQRCGVTPGRVYCWIRHGLLPADANGNPRIADGLQWVAANYRPRKKTSSSSRRTRANPHTPIESAQGALLQSMTFVRETR